MGEGTVFWTPKVLLKLAFCYARLIMRLVLFGHLIEVFSLRLGPPNAPDRGSMLLSGGFAASKDLNYPNAVRFFRHAGRALD